MKKYLLIGFGIIINYSALAQGDFRSGYIIKNNNDSVPGLIDYRSTKSNSRYCFFKEGRKGSKLKYSPEDLKGYGFIDDKYYESKRLKGYGDRKVFIEVLVKGSLSLYTFKSIFYVERDSLIVLPKNESTLVVTDKGTYSKQNNRYIGILNLIISACDLSANKIRYDQKELTYLIQNYNRCKGGAGLVYKKNLPWTKVDFQLFTGHSTSNLKVDGFANNAFRTSRTIIGGTGIDFSSPRLNSKTFFSLEAWYVQNLYQGYSKSSDGNTTTRSDFFINTSFIKIPLGIRFNLLKENQTPYLKFGFVQYFRHAATLKIISESEVSGVVTTSVSEDKLNGKSQQGFWCSVGYTKGIVGRYKGFAEVRYEKTNGFVGSSVESNSSITNIQFLLGLRF